jgi:hypothetical protein
VLRFELRLLVLNFIYFFGLSVSILVSQLNILIIFNIIKLMTTQLVVQLLKLFVAGTMRGQSHLLKLRASCAFFKTRWISLRLFHRPGNALLPSCVTFSPTTIRSCSIVFYILIMRTKKLSISSTSRTLCSIVTCHLTKLTSGTVLLIYLLTCTTCSLRSISMLIRRIRLQISTSWRIALIPATS